MGNDMVWFEVAVILEEICLGGGEADECGHVPDACVFLVYRRDACA